MQCLFMSYGVVFCQNLQHTLINNVPLGNGSEKTHDRDDTMRLELKIKEKCCKTVVKLLQIWVGC